MSQAGILSDQTNPLADVETLTGNDGVAVGPNGAGNINFIGNTAQGVSVSGNAGTNTETVTVQNATAAATSGTASKGVSSYDSHYFSVASGYVSLASATNATGQTIGAVTADIITLPLGATPGTYTFEVRVSGFESTTPAAAGSQIFATVRTTGAAAVLVGVPDVISNSEAAVNTSLANVVVSGNSAIVRVTGVALLTINWGADLEYTFRG